MALPAHALHIPAGLKIDENTRPELVEPGSANLYQENVRPTERGALAKRFGFGVGSLARADGTTRGAGHRHYADGFVTNVIDGSTVDGDVRAASVAKSLGRLPEAVHRLMDLPTLSQSGSVEDVEYCNGYLAVAGLMILGGQYYTCAFILDATTQAVVHGPYLFGTFVMPMICSYGNYFLAIKANTSSAAISVMYLDTTSATTIANGWIAAGGSVTTAWNFSMSACSMSDRIAIAYNVNAGTNRVEVKTWTIAGQAEATSIATAGVAAVGVDCAIGPYADTLWVSWTETTTSKVCGLTPTALGTVLAATGAIVTSTNTNAPTRVVAHPSVNGQGRLWVDDIGAGNIVLSRARSFATSLGTATASGTAVSYPGVERMARPFAYGTRYYIMVTAGDVSNSSVSAPNTQCLVDWTDDVTWVRPVCAVEPNLSVASVSVHSKTVAAPVGGSKLFATLNVARSSVANAAQLVELDFASSDRWQPVRFGNSTYLSGGVLGYVDGTRFTEAGFLHRPTKPVTSTSGTGITLTLGRRYVAVYEAVDADGNLTISGVSDPSASTGAVANKTITITTTPCAMTYRLDATGLALAASRVVLYATGDTGGVPPYYRHSVVANDTSSLTATFTDTTTDATLTANAKLYEQPAIPGTALDRRAPPGPRHVANYAGLLVCATGSNVWHSGQPVIGESAWFNPVFQVPIPGDGEITGLAVQDGTLFVFKRRAIFALAGEWPSDNGTAGGLGQPRMLAVDVGCIEQRSIVVTSLGIFFQSDRGLELLTRAQSVEYVGREVSDTLAAYPYVNAATLEPTQNLVVFELSSGRSSGLAQGTGVALVYSLTNGGWFSVDRRHNQAGAADAPAQSACLVWNGSAWRYSWLDAYGDVYTEDQATHLDPGSTWVTATWETPWVKHALQQQQRIWRGTILYERASAAGLKIEVAYDYDAYSSADDKVWTEAETSGERELELRPRSLGAAMKFRVSDSAPETLGTGAGFTWIGISFDMAPKQGATQATPRLDPALRK